MKNKILLAATLLCLQVSLLFAQDTSSVHMPCGFSDDVGIAHFNNLSNLNNSLKLFNYPQFTNYGYELMGKLLIGKINDAAYASFELGSSAPIADGEINNISSNLSVMDIMINLNINLSYKKNSKRKFFFIPYLGLGYTISTLSITNNSNSSKPFDSTLSLLSGQKVVTSNVSYSINMGLSVQKSISKYNEWFLGLRAGYELQLNNPKWDLGNANNYTTDNPKINLGSLYAGLSVSFY